jgi:hypothetical protein
MYIIFIVMHFIAILSFFAVATQFIVYFLYKKSQGLTSCI